MIRLQQAAEVLICNAADSAGSKRVSRGATDVTGAASLPPFTDKATDRQCGGEKVTGRNGSRPTALVGEPKTEIMNILSHAIPPPATLPVGHIHIVVAASIYIQTLCPTSR